MAAGAQTYETHRRTVPLYHFVLYLCLLIDLGWSIYRLVTAPSGDTAVGVVAAIALVLTAVFTRVFPLRAQDRVIRLEMWLRLNDVLPADLRPRIRELTPRQLIALRFASDHELPALTARVLADNIQDPTAIKKMIREWQPDELRV